MEYKYPEGLLYGFTFYCSFFKSNNIITQKIVQKLIKYGKGKIIKNLDQAKQFMNYNQLNTKFFTIGNKRCSTSLILDKIPIIHYKWIIHSIIGMKLRNINKYKMAIGI